MLWSNPTILYDTILDYRLNEFVSWSQYWKMKHDPTVAIMRSGSQLCTVTLPSNIRQTSILWQHLFLDPLLQKMQIGWHLCLLPRRMIVVIKEGLYVCERIPPENEELIESTKAYLYRFGYESDVSIQIHDFRQRSEQVSIPIDYMGFVLQPYQPWHLRIKAVASTFLSLYFPHTLTILGATFLSLSLGSFYREYQNYIDGQDRVHVLHIWPQIQTRQARVQKFFELVGVLTEAKAPAQLIQTVRIDDTGVVVGCSGVFPPPKNLEVVTQFLKKYYPHAVTVKTIQNKNLEISL